jgi:hypothetical protein
MQVHDVRITVARAGPIAVSTPLSNAKPPRLRQVVWKLLHNPPPAGRGRSSQIRPAASCVISATISIFLRRVTLQDGIFC